MISTILWYFILLSSHARLLVDALCDADRYTNGCSVPLGLDTPFKKTFTEACNKHDICYGCVSSLDINIYMFWSGELKVKAGDNAWGC